MDELEILALVADALGVDAPLITRDTVQTDIPEWDSLGQLALLQKLDDCLIGGVSEIDGIGTVKSIADLLSMLKAAGRLS